MSAPQHPSTTATDETEAPAATATSGEIPLPSESADDDGVALPDPGPADADAVIDAVDTDETPAAADGSAADASAPAASGRPTGTRDDDLLVREGDVAGDYLERLLDILDLDGDIDLDVEGDRASVAIVGGRLDDLIGQDGATLEALQELTRLAVAQATGVRSRLMLDVGEFRAKRRADLTSLAGAVARRVADSRQPERLAPMNPFERKVVHDVIAGVDGVRSESEGEEPSRRVVVLPDR
jgi:spoIIIJ-associated protein